MFKQIVFFFCLALLVFGGYQLYVSMAPAETQIRWAIEEAADAFNERDKATVLATFADDYTDASQGGDYYEEHIIDKQLLAQGLDHMFTKRIEAETGDSLYKVKPVMQTLSIKLESEIHADVQVRMMMRVKMGHTWTDVWSVAITAKMRKTGQDWVIASSTLRTLMGNRPWNWE